MTIQASSTPVVTAGAARPTPAAPTQGSAPTPGGAPHRSGVQQLATVAVRAIRDRLAVDLVWIAEVAGERRYDRASADGDEGCGPPCVTVLATSATKPTGCPPRADPVLPTCLTQIAWDVALLGHTFEMRLRNPTRALAAFPITLQTGTRLVLITVAAPDALTPRDMRTLTTLVDALGQRASESL